MNILGISHVTTTFIFKDAKSWPLLVDPPSITTSDSQHAWTHISNRPHLLRTCKLSCCQTIEATCCASFQGCKLASPHVNLLPYPTNYYKNCRKLYIFLVWKKYNIREYSLVTEPHFHLYVFIFSLQAPQRVVFSCEYPRLNVWLTKGNVLSTPKHPFSLVYLVFVWRLEARFGPSTLRCWPLESILCVKVTIKNKKD